MKKTKKIISIFILIMLLIFLPETRAFNNDELKSNVQKIISSNVNNDKKNNNKPECTYKEGEVIITYEKSFWNSDAKLSLGSFFDKYKVDATTQFDDIKIDSDKTVSIDKSESKESTLGISLVKSDKHTTKELIDIFKDKDWIISVEPNYIIKTTSLTDDTYGMYQWALDNTGQNSGTKDLDINPIATSSENEKVIAILDTGVDYTHEDLKNVMWVNPYSEKDLPGTYGYNFLNDNSDPMDDNGHGTHVAGIIAGEPNNNKGIAGATLGASNIKIMALKILDERGETNDIYSTIQAYNYIYKAQELGTNIIAVNNSWGSYAIVKKQDDRECLNSLLSVINLVGEKGALSICASGNEYAELNEQGEIAISIDEYNEEERKELMKYADSKGNIMYKEFPAGLDSDYIVSVGASTENDELATFSNYGSSVDIAAPGSNIISTMIENIYSSYNPLVLSEEEKKEVLKEYYNFDNGLGDLNYTLTYSGEEADHHPDKGMVTISNNTFYGVSGKSLKWTFNWTKEDEEKSKALIATWPCLQLNLNQFVNSCTSVAVYAKGPKQSTSSVNLWGPWAVQPEDKLPNEEWCTYIGGAGYQNNYWETTNFNLRAFEAEELSGRIDVIPYPDVAGEYTIYIDNFMISKPFETMENNHVVKYAIENGTSMAAPFVTGAVGTLSNLHENETALQLKDRILSCTRKSNSLTGKVATGGVLDLSSEIIKVTGITLDKTSAELKVGEILQLTPTITPEEVAIKDVIWTSSNTEVASVENGEVTALAEGTSIITATTQEGGFQATCEVTVEKVKLSSIEITKEPTKKEYIEGQNFDASGMKVTAKYNNDTSKEVTNYTVTDGENLQVGKTNVTISYTEAGITKTVTQKITVIPNLEISFDEYKEILKEQKQYLINVLPNTTMKDIVNHIHTNGTINIINGNEKNINNQEKISTGMKLTITLNNESREFIIVVKGDTNGDGDSNLKDLLQVNKHRLNKVLLKGEFLLSGDVTGDNVVDLKDLLKINKFRLGKIVQY